MSFKYCLALALVPCAVGAQQNNPADAKAIVPAANHVSTFKEYRSADDPTTTPDRDWRAANARVKSEAGGEHKMHQPPAVEIKIKTGADPHADHVNHAAPMEHAHHAGHQ